MIRRILLLGAGFLFLSPAGVWACACNNVTPGTCQGLNVADAIFVGTVTQAETVPEPNGSQPGDTPLAHYRFHVDENFKAAKDPEIDVYSGGNDGDCAYRFKQGEKYLVLAYTSDDGRLFATICSGTRPAKEAVAMLPQLEAIKRGEKVASIFGLLRRTDPPYEAISDGPTEEPLASVDLKLRSNLNRLETATDTNGIYTLYNVPAGEYHMFADLPKFLALTEPTSKGPLPPIFLAEGGCYEFDLDALPIGTIRGSILGPDKKPLHPASVELYRSDRYQPTRAGWWAFQGDKGSFEFDHVPPGDYILVFNRRNRRDPNAPYPRAFYPGTPDVNQAKVIEVSEGGDVVNADLQLSGGFKSRRIKVAVKWPKTEDLHGVFVTAKADQGGNPIAYRLPNGSYEVTLLEGVNYQISGWGYVGIQKPAARPKASHRTKTAKTSVAGDADSRVVATFQSSPQPPSGGADPVCGPGGRIDATPLMVDGSDASLKEVTLTFPQVSCSSE
jgi:hypothetical protein